MMKKTVSEKSMMQKNKKNKDDRSLKNNRFLITINILGSVGPIRFVVNEKDLVSVVIDTALKSYAREGRLPVLGSDVNNFLLYCENYAESGALSPMEAIGSHGARNFVLCKKQKQPLKTEGRSEMISQKRSGWKSWLNKSFSFKIISH